MPTPYSLLGGNGLGTGVRTLRHRHQLIDHDLTAVVDLAPLPVDAPQRPEEFIDAAGELFPAESRLATSALMMKCRRLGLGAGSAEAVTASSSPFTSSSSASGPPFTLTVFGSLVLLLLLWL